MPPDRGAFAAFVRDAHGKPFDQVLSHDELVAWGTMFGALLPRPAVVTLTGDLGAGKTTVTRAICAGLGVHDVDAVTSPTYSLIHEYAAPFGAVVHADLYRLRSATDLHDLGWDELVANAAVLLIEWPELVADRLPSDVIAIELRHDSRNADVRQLVVRAAK